MLPGSCAWFVLGGGGGYCLVTFCSITDRSTYKKISGNIFVQNAGHGQRLFGQPSDIADSDITNFEVIDDLYVH